MTAAYSPDGHSLRATKVWVGVVLAGSLGVAGGLALQAVTEARRSFPSAPPLGSIRGLQRPAANAGGVAPFILQTRTPEERERAVRCLTDAVYYEAADEPVQGQRAVAQVVVNRLRDKHFPKSVCGVVFEGWERRTGCQFSFVCDGSIRRRPADPRRWSQLRPIAEAALSGFVEPEVGSATHYHAEYVRPNWLSSVARISEVGKHIFYSWKGRAGLASALNMPYGGGEFSIAEAALAGGRSVRAARATLRGAPCRRLRPCRAEPRLVRMAHAGRGQGGWRSGPVRVRFLG